MYSKAHNPIIHINVHKQKPFPRPAEQKPRLFPLCHGIVAKPNNFDAQHVVCRVSIRNVMDTSVSRLKIYTVLQTASARLQFERTPRSVCSSVNLQCLFLFLTFCWPCISVYLSQYLTNLMHKICFTISFISCLYMFRAHVLIIRRPKLH